jgi:hypothetical protein
MSPKQVTSPKIPKLRFQEFQGEWEEKPLSNFLFETKKRNK